MIISEQSQGFFSLLPLTKWIPISMFAPKCKENKDLHQTNTAVESFQDINRGLSVFILCSDQKRQRRIYTATGESLIRRLKKKLFKGRHGFRYC